VKRKLMNGKMYRLAAGVLLLALGLQVMTPLASGLAHHEASVEPIVAAELPPCETLLRQGEQVKGEAPAPDAGGEVEPAGILWIRTQVFRPFYHDGRVWGWAWTEGNLLPLFTQITTTVRLYRWDGTRWVQKASDTRHFTGAFGVKKVWAGAAFKLCNPHECWWACPADCPRIGALWLVRSTHLSTHPDGSAGATRRSPSTHVDPPGPAPPPGAVALDSCCN